MKPLEIVIKTLAGNAQHPNQRSETHMFSAKYSTQWQKTLWDRTLERDSFIGRNKIGAAPAFPFAFLFISAVFEMFWFFLFVFWFFFPFSEHFSFSLFFCYTRNLRVNILLFLPMYSPIWIIQHELGASCRDRASFRRNPETHWVSGTWSKQCFLKPTAQWGNLKYEISA